MRLFSSLGLSALLIVLASPAANPAEISGEYLEARSCDVYTGPCFANGQMGSAGKEAVMAWKVDEGRWKGTGLSGLGVALVLNAEGTLGYDGVFPMTAGAIHSVILVDNKATPEQQAALIDFVKDSAKEVIGSVKTVKRVPLSLKNDHLAGKGVLKAGDLAAIETRALKKADCTCCNEINFYLPLAKVDNSSPAYAQTLSYKGDGLNTRWTLHNLRSAYLGTFER
jgi:hypothetical protein